MRRALLALLLLTCQEDVGKICFRPSYVPPLQTTFVCSKDPRKPAFVHVKIVAGDETFEQTVPFSQPDLQFDIPIGPMRSVRMDLLDIQNCILYTATRAPVSFVEGDNGVLFLSMRPPNPTGDYVDADHDGLPLCVERALGTRDTADDSDGDGYSDFCEVTGAAGRCTDPAKASDHPSQPPAACEGDGGADGGVRDGGAGTP